MLATLGPVATLMLAGCATPVRMAFEDEAQRLDEKSKPVQLLTVVLKNNYRADFQPKMLVLYVEKPGAKEAADRLNFLMDSRGRIEGAGPDGNTYLVRLQLEPGKYELRGVMSRGGFFPVMGMFFTPLHLPLEVRENGVSYLGKVRATVRERQGDEFRAGSPLPLIDQAVIGASGGTFDVDILDDRATDEATFRRVFPALKDVPVKKAILPPFDRPRAQKWWETNM
ncbi:hypothetical protein HK414_05970 [Ramlibacter terrae]|uniref:Lipoprotein n=1 Tax=Ramlibacter terrae TaxID=2732511 RepID=A0ABX6P0Z2_9BURK|nr:hypothetical protein HK414_05970 [Ramlibacter terrae]